jgi:GTP-binding protein EngB required for normal cell division
MYLKDEIIKWLLQWDASPERVMTYIDKLKWAKQNDTKDDYFALLLLAVSSGRAYEVKREELKFALRQLINLLYEKETK